MISEKQIEANRRNALLSTGPKTEDGPQPLPPQRAPPRPHRPSHHHDRRRPRRPRPILQSPHKRPRPRRSHGDPTRPAHRHRQLASQSHQRHRRQPLRPRPTSEWRPGMPRSSPKSTQPSPPRTSSLRSRRQLQLLTLYEQRLNRAIQKNLAMLQSLQATRKAATPSRHEGSRRPPETQ